MAHDRRAHKRIVTYRARIVESEELHEVEYDAVADALHFACRDLRESRRLPLEILEDGVRMLDEEAIREECRKRGEEMREEHGIG